MFQLHHNRLTSIPMPPISLSHLHLGHNEIADIDGNLSFKIISFLIYTFAQFFLFQFLWSSINWLFNTIYTTLQDMLATLVKIDGHCHWTSSIFKQSGHFSGKSKLILQSLLFTIVTMIPVFTDGSRLELRRKFLLTLNWKIPIGHGMIHKSECSNVAQLFFVKLDFDQIVYYCWLFIGRQPWPVMNSLLYVDLDNNMLLDSLERGKFSNLNVLGTLKLRNNNITK